MSAGVGRIREVVDSVMSVNSVMMVHRVDRWIPNHKDRVLVSDPQPSNHDHNNDKVGDRVMGLHSHSLSPSYVKWYKMELDLLQVQVYIVTQGDMLTFTLVVPTKLELPRAKLRAKDKVKVITEGVGVLAQV